MARPKPKATVSWKAVAQLMAYVQFEKRMLAVLVNVDDLSVAAVETTVPAKGSRIARAQHVFDQHGHSVVGAFDSLPAAMAAAEAFAAKWLAGVSIERCGCGEIATV